MKKRNKKSYILYKMLQCYKRNWEPRNVKSVPWKNCKVANRKVISFRSNRRLKNFVHACLEVFISIRYTIITSGKIKKLIEI